MFDSEDLVTCLNSLYEANVTDDMLTLIHEANKVTHFAVKTPNGITEKTKIENKILQGDVMAPLMSSNMVDKNIGSPAINAQNVYLYKGKVPIPPLTMQDDTLGVSECGFKSRKTNNFLNTRTNIMGLQFGRDKCVKMHIGKKQNENICTAFEVDVWEDVIESDLYGNEELKDTYFGKEKMKEVSHKKYLGDIIQNDMKNDKNIKDKTDKAVGNVNKILSALNERPYGRHSYKAAVLMRQGILLGGLLTNAETWINITEKDIDNLSMPDTILQREILSSSGNPSKVFMFLELGIIPVKYVIMGKRLNFLNTLLRENTSLMLSQVYTVLKSDSRNGDFFALVQKDKTALNIQLIDEEVKTFSKHAWKKYKKSKLKKLYSKC